MKRERQHIRHDVGTQALAKDRFKDSFPPIIFHLTDGESQSDAEPLAQQIMSLSSSDGDVR